MSKQEKKKPIELAEVEEQVLSSTEQFIEMNKNVLLYGVSLIVIGVLAVLAFRNFYLVPQEEEAAKAIYSAQEYFAVDSFALALHGDDIDCIGFEGVIEEYGITTTADLAGAYAGICYFKLGDYAQAAELLGDYDGDDLNVAPVVKQLLGDAYVELGNLEKAVKVFKAVAATENPVFSPMSLKKAGVVYEELGEIEAALDMYNVIKEDYPRSTEAADIDKYIGRLEIKK